MKPSPTLAPLYKAALLEFESRKLIERSELAEIAIKDRLHDLRLDSNITKSGSLSKMRKVL